MNQVDEGKTSGNSENDVARPGQWLSPDGIQPLPGREQEAAPNPADTAQEAVHEVMTKDAAQSIAPIAGDKELHAAKGDDDLMSKPPTPMPPAGKDKGERWKRQIGPAKLLWTKLSDEELTSSQGRGRDLAQLVQDRYAITRAEADLQVRGFFQKHAA